VIKASDFASVLQLGAGIGIGLSFFRAGFDRKQRALKRRFARAGAAYDNPATREERKHLTELSTLRTRFGSRVSRADRRVTVFQVAAFIGGIANMILLAWVTFHGDQALSRWEQFVGLAASLGYFSVLLAALEIWLLVDFGFVGRDLHVFEVRKGLGG
jgi:hypothetical protein